MYNEDLLYQKLYSGSRIDVKLYRKARCTAINYIQDLISL